MDQPTPESSARRPDLRGVEVVLADGQTWTLADYIPDLAPVWDQLYDHNLISQGYNLADLHLASFRLLLENYDLPADFAVWLIDRTDPDALVTAVEGALFGVRNALRGWSDWATGSLLANGIDPAIVPPERRRDVLDLLVASGRTVPASKFTSAGRAAAKRQGLLDDLKRAGIKPTPQNPEG